MFGSSKIHNRFLDSIIQEPMLIGLSNIVNVEKEFVLRNSHGRVIAEPDLILQDVYNNLYIGEYKCHDSVTGRSKAQKQLLTADNFMYMNYKIHPLMLLYIHDFYVTERYSKRNDCWIPFTT